VSSSKTITVNIFTGSMLESYVVKLLIASFLQSFSKPWFNFCWRVGGFIPTFHKQNQLSGFWVMCTSFKYVGQLNKLKTYVW
jgi:hypothetical protein